MIRGTTPTLSFGVPFQIENVKEMYITFQQDGRTVLEKKKEDFAFSDREVILVLHQEDTLRMKDTSVLEIQMRVVFVDNTAVASEIVKSSVGRILKDGKI